MNIKNGLSTNRSRSQDVYQTHIFFIAFILIHAGHQPVDAQSNQQIDTGPSWSPDELWIGFSSNRDE